ncbi:MAG: glycerol-3-phosphate 1-O-acyltransferase PlsY [Leptolyngbyaceae bacterium]|nr:glycerol-3-phosphate 1-O-acyltransferase PlsY [Leptolyngbyaceae bacterium]
MGLLWGGIAGLCLVAYLLGSLPTGYWVAKQLKGIDIREHGSGSTGATNVLRTIGKGPGLLVFVVDIGKGVAPVLLTRWATGLLAADVAPSLDWLPWVVVLAGALAILGHSRSIWLNFTGGKSVATGLGVMFALHWPTGLIAFGVFGLLLAVFRIVSLGSIGGAIAAPTAMFLLGQPLAYGVFAIAAGGYVINRHRSNIQRLLAGTEPRIGQKLESVSSKP